jgi:hypothetical protein
VTLRSTRTARAAALLAGLFAVAAGGCGPIEYLSQVSRRAEQTLERARREGAATYAPYELTAATEYLDQAREEASHSQYGPALEYGRRAEDLGNRALAISREKSAKRGRRGAFDEQRPAPEEEPPRR